MATYKTGATRNRRTVRPANAVSGFQIGVYSSDSDRNVVIDPNTGILTVEFIATIDPKTTNPAPTGPDRWSEGPAKNVVLFVDGVLTPQPAAWSWDNNTFTSKRVDHRHRPNQRLERNARERRQLSRQLGFYTLVI